jgi:hypothetical protein
VCCYQGCKIKQKIGLKNIAAKILWHSKGGMIHESQIAQHSHPWHHVVERLWLCYTLHPNP